MKEFSLNQIVKGKFAGTFVILGFRKIDGVEYVQLKPVNPDNHRQHGIGEIALPIISIEEID